MLSFNNDVYVYPALPFFHSALLCQQPGLLKVQRPYLGGVEELGIQSCWQYIYSYKN